MGYVLVEGDKIVCVAKEGLTPGVEFTIGKTYIVDKTFYGRCVLDDNNNPEYVELYTDNFIRLEEFRNNKLNDIGI